MNNNSDGKQGGPEEAAADKAAMAMSRILGAGPKPPAQEETAAATPATTGTVSTGTASTSDVSAADAPTMAAAELVGEYAGESAAKVIGKDAEPVGGPSADKSAADEATTIEAQSGKGPAGNPPRIGRPSPAVLAGCALAGLAVLLVSAAVILATHHTGSHPAAAAGPAQQAGVNPGFVPTIQASSGSASGHSAKGTKSGIRTTSGTRPGSGNSSTAGSSGSASGGTPKTNGQSQSGSKPSSSGTTSKSSSGDSATTATTYSAVAGPGCGTADGQGYTQYDYYTDSSDPEEGWMSATISGGPCGGSFDALPMSGSATSDEDDGIYTTWSFNPGSYKACTIEVYIPDDTSEVYVGGNPAHYSLHNMNGSVIPGSGFHIYQYDSLGQWVDAGQVTTGNPFYLRMDNTGQDWTGNTKTYAHDAAAQVRVTCS
jgi:hypothetical protein